MDVPPEKIQENVEIFLNKITGKVTEEENARDVSQPKQNISNVVMSEMEHNTELSTPFSLGRQTFTNRQKYGRGLSQQGNKCDQLFINKTRQDNSREQTPLMIILRCHRR